MGQLETALAKLETDDASSVEISDGTRPPPARSANKQNVSEMAQMPRTYRAKCGLITTVVTREEWEALRKAGAIAVSGPLDGGDWHSNK